MPLMLGITKPNFSPFTPDFSREILEKNPVLFPSENFAGRSGPHWNLRLGAPGRTRIFQVPPLHTWSEGHGRFKTNELIFRTAMPRDRRIAHLFIQIQVESDYFKIICVSQIILFASSICDSSCFSVQSVPKSASGPTAHGSHAVRVIDNAPGTRPSRVTNFNVDARMLKVMIHGA